MTLLWPKEHGAYGQLFFPLGTALVLGPRATAVGLAAACVAVFVAHEAVLTLLGRRSGRVARERRRDAIFSLACCGAVAAGAGGAAMMQMAPASRPLVGVPIALAAVLALFIASGREQSTGGEIWAAVALSSCGVPVAVAGGVTESRALVCWLVFGLSFTVATLAVRATIARVKRPNGGSSPGASPATAGSQMWLAPAIIGAAIVSAARGWVPAAAAVALLPVCGLAVVLAWFPPHPRRLREVGWSLVAATAVTAIVLAIGA